MNSKLLILSLLFSLQLYSQRKLISNKVIEDSTSLNSNNNYTVNNQTILLDETFGSGVNTITSGIDPAYCWNNQPYPNGQICGNNPVVGFPFPSCGNYTIEDNQYNVTSVINPNNCSWFDYRDHSSNSTNPTGRFLAINIGAAAGPTGVLYSKQIDNIVQNQTILVELYAGNLIKTSVSGAIDPAFLLELVDGNGVVVSNYYTGLIPKTNSWIPITTTLDPGNNTSLKFKIRSSSSLYSGNDAVIDDIKLSQSVVLSTSQYIFDSVIIYPNPAVEQLYVDNIALHKVVIYNVLGHQVREVKCNGSLNNILDLKGIGKGVFFLNLQTDKSTFIKRLIVQ